MKKSRRKADFAVWILAGCLAAGSSGCGRAGEWKPSAATEDLTGQYLSQTADYRDVSVTDTFRKSYTDFSLQLLRESRREQKDQEESAGIKEENQLVGPLSVMAALEMTRSGARGETAEQMARTLYGEAVPEEMPRELMAYLQTLPNQEKAGFHSANSIWYRRENTTFAVDPDFLKNSAVDYGAQIYQAPFDESTVKDINRWVEQETDGMISKILERIPEADVMFLVNGMAFDAEWKKQYNTDQIHEAEFHPQKGEPKTVEMMYSQESVLIQGDGVKGFVKPYQEGYGFLALLPEQGLTIDAYLEGLSGEGFLKLLEQADDETVEAGLPKYSARTQLTLNEMLKHMGMPLAFDMELADFSGMGRDPEGNIYIGSAIHSTFIQVDEKGTRAGAATVVEMMSGGAEMEQERVILDRPFLYAIIDVKEKLPIFIGIVDTVE